MLMTKMIMTTTYVLLNNSSPPATTHNKICQLKEIKETAYSFYDKQPL